VSTSPTDEVHRRDVLTALAALGLVACATTSHLVENGSWTTLAGGKMKVGRIYATADGESHIGELDIRLTQNEGRPLFSNSTRFAATAMGYLLAQSTAALAGLHPRGNLGDRDQRRLPPPVSAGQRFARRGYGGQGASW
jgi:hypothetical protein